MTQEKKELLLRDLCARLPYDVVVRCYFVDGGGEEVLDTDDIADLLYNEENSEFPMYKPYLRPMSSMTEEEKKEYESLCILIPISYNSGLGTYNYYTTDSIDSYDWLNAHHFDYRNLIEKGLALEAKEGIYKEAEK